MAGRCLLYYITDRAGFPGDEHTRRRRLLEKISEATSCGVNYIQLREKDLPGRQLESLAHEAMSIIEKLRSHSGKLRTALLINSRTDIALATHADGVHLRSGDVSPQEVRMAWKRGAGSFDPEGVHRELIIGVSCHSAQDVIRAATSRTTFAVFAPVFEKEGASPAGLDALREACRANIPVLALGGITLENAGSCLRAGAGGIAAIRLFQENDVSKVVRALRA